MNTVDWMRRFKHKLLVKFEMDMKWREEEIREMIRKVYEEVLNEMIDPRNDGKEEKE